MAVSLFLLLVLFGPAPVSSAQLTDEQVLAASRDIQQRLLEGDPAGFSDYFGDDGFFDLLVAGVDVEPEERRGLMANLKMGEELGQQIAAATQQGGSYFFLRLIPTDKSPRAMFRLLLPDGGVNYHELVFVPNEQSQPAIVDVEVYLVGERLSASLRRMLLPHLVNSKQSRLAKLIGKENLYVTHQNEMFALLQEASAGDPHETLRLYDQLPEELQNDLLIMTNTLMATQKIGLESKEYKEFSEKFRASQTQGSNAELIAMDPLMFAERYEELLEVVGRLDERVGGDPYLHIMRANVYNLQEQPAKSLAAAQIATAQAPELADSHWTLLELAIIQKRFDLALSAMTALDRDFGVEFEDDLAAIDFYAEFAASPEHGQWMDYLKQK